MDPIPLPETVALRDNYYAALVRDASRQLAKIVAHVESRQGYGWWYHGNREAVREVVEMLLAAEALDPRNAG